MDYPGKIITKNQVTPTQTSASGNWTLDDAAAAVRNNNWPVAGVPNPISKSLRFNSADSAYLNRTPGVAGNRKTWTWSGWVKRTTLGATTSFFAAAVDASNRITFNFGSGDTLSCNSITSGVSTNLLISTAVYRDASAWYHIVIAFDSTQATASNRLKIYVNGSEVTAFGTDNRSSITQNSDGYVNNNILHSIGRNEQSPQTYANYYLTEVNFIDGQALTPTDFGLTDPQTGQWIPKKYTGTYGTNGFYLNFKDATSTTTLGYDYSGNGNNWTTNNFSVTAGAGNDSLTDVPTPWIAYNTTGDVGGVFRGNYCTLNPLNTNGFTISNGNLDCSVTGGTAKVAVGTIAVSSGKWYWEVVGTSGSNLMIGVSDAAAAITSSSWTTANGWTYYLNGEKFNNNSGSAYGATYTTNDVIGVALDMDTGTLVFYKNGVSQGTAFNTGLSGKTIVPMISNGSSTNSQVYTANFGQRPFAYTPPAGFLSLCTTNLPTPTIGATSTTQAGKYFDVLIYTGDGNSTKSITLPFAADFLWSKNRTTANSHVLIDTVRGGTSPVKTLFSDATNAEFTTTGDFNNYGYPDSLSGTTYSVVKGTQTTSYTNKLNDSYVNWLWKANGAGSSNTDGTITSTVSANTTAGFSIVTYTGTGANATVGHGLGVAPKMVIVKCRSDIASWPVYHASLGATKYISLDLTDNATTISTRWNDTAPTSTVFSLGTHGSVNTSSRTYVAYCFAEVVGYSAFGSYTGNGSTDGPFVYTGFRPRYVLIKRTDTTGTWLIEDTGRNTYNLTDLSLSSESSAAELTQTTAGNPIDILSSGFKCRGTGASSNANTGTYIYAAFAESPFKFSNAR